MQKREFPILEFDPESRPIIEPSLLTRPQDVPDSCVLCFFHDVVDRVIREQSARIIYECDWEDGPHRVYELNHKGRRLGLMQPGVGAPIATGLLEMAIALGFRRFVACGGAGTLAQGHAVGHIVVPVAAVRDEGTSYHYMAPSREIAMDPEIIAVLVRILQEKGLRHSLGKTWTTDAPYRETRAKTALRRSEGCLTVEMETAALLAVARYRGVKFGQFLYCGDDLSGDEWDDRGWRSSRGAVRKGLLTLAADACLAMPD